MVLGGWMSKKCPNCGKVIENNDEQYCGFCGEKLNSITEKPKHQTSKKDDNTITINRNIFYGILLLILILVVACSSLINESSEDSYSNLPPLTVDSCVATWNEEYNETQINIVGTALKSMRSDNGLETQSASVTMKNGEIIEVYGYAMENNVKKGDKVHITFDEKFASEPVNISFHMSDGVGSNGRDYGAVSAKIKMEEK